MKVIDGMGENLIKHIHHPFYKKVDKLVEDVRMMQLRKGAEKYPEPFTPSSWTGKELAIHALQELRDGQVYVVGLYERIEELEGENQKIKESYKDRESDIDSYQEMLGIEYEDMAIELPIEKIQGEEINRVKQQNKHYRDALIYVLKTRLESYDNPENMLEDIKSVVNGVLEGTE